MQVMCEQLTLFERTDPLHLVCEWLKKRHKREVEKGWITKDHPSFDFSVFVCDFFKSYCGGSLRDDEIGKFAWYDFTPTGCTLSDLNFVKEVYIKKNDILRELGISERQMRSFEEDETEDDE